MMVALLFSTFAEGFLAPQHLPPRRGLRWLLPLVLAGNVLATFAWIIVGLGLR